MGVLGELMVSCTAFTIFHSSEDLIMIEAISDLAEQSVPPTKEIRENTFAEIKKYFVGRTN